MEALPLGGSRDRALRRIRNLDCSSSDKALASCDPSAAASPEAVGWRKELEGARVNDRVYAKALAGVLKGLICSSEDDVIYVVRGEAFAGAAFCYRRRRDRSDRRPYE